MSDQWSLGALAQVHYASASVGTNDARSPLNALAPVLLMSATYH